ncbi:hypothetical protein U8335_25780 [Roseiconus lacunae]|uniref:hypothetical protein n=1 Tax=Roseiconus lacunae TaxID=2605694 RepID=UPI00308E249F|nr:hypothetical protein U8335_25780 [Stieleria sp. HD01]
MSKTFAKHQPQNTDKLARQELPKYRGDLEVYSHRRGGKTVWVMKDPVTLRYYQFSSEEFFVIRHLDGSHTREQIRKRFQEQFVSQRISESEITAFINRLDRNGLMMAKRSRQGDQFLQNARSLRSRKRFAAVTNPLAIRIPGFNPSRLIEFLYANMRSLLSPIVIVSATVLIVVMGMSLVFKHQTARERLPDLNAFLSPQNMVVLAIVMAAVKVLHELAHAITCRHFGGQCHEMGVMLLLFTPCLYCDVTDSWTLRQRRHRILISAAGIFVELCLASLATLLWWIAEPGLLSTILLNVMVVCSVGTFMINANPLLRYDGYFIVSDLFDAPNLWQRSQQELSNTFRRCLIGTRSCDREPTPNLQRATLLVYGLASWLYRGFVIVTIILLIQRSLIPKGLDIVAWLLIGLVFVGIARQPIASMARWLHHPSCKNELLSMRLSVRVAMAVTLLGVMCLLPIPCRLHSVAVLEGARTRQVFVSVPGTLIQRTPIGEFVQAGTTIATLENLGLERELESLRSRVHGQKQRLSTLHAIRGRNEIVAQQIPTATESLQDLTEQLARLERDQQALTLKAPIDGYVIPAAGLEKTVDHDFQLVSWQGRPTDEANLGAYLSRQTVFCAIGDPTQATAIAYVDQSEIGLVSTGQSVTLVFESGRGQIKSGIVSAVGQVDIDRVPAELVAQQWLPTREGKGDEVLPLQTLYPVAIKVQSNDSLALIGGRASVKIHVDSQPFLTQLKRLIGKVFSDVL